MQEYYKFAAFRSILKRYKNICVFTHLQKIFLVTPDKIDRNLKIRTVNSEFILKLSTGRMKNIDDIYNLLTSLAESSYRDFTAKLTPGCLPPIGVRLPALRRIARQLVKDQPLFDSYVAYICSGAATHHEQVLLCGLAIGYLHAYIQTVLQLLDTLCGVQSSGPS